MSTESWDRLEELFTQLRDLPDSARTAALDAAGVDASLRAEVETLLRASTDDTRLSIERLVQDEVSSEERDTDSWLGQRLGPWRVARAIGRGGMGVVYAAARCDGAFDLEVAVKLLQSGARNPSAVERFRIERQVLAALKHPCIAGLVDGGFAPDGTPYLVMELVDGVPIVRWATDSGAPAADRLRLFRRVCDAVQHAHRALVVHRDIKPSNILVTRDGDVKLMDFGIAKLLEPSTWGLRETDTRVEMRALTPAYAAPEQVRGDPVTTATDVYALGVLLHELLTGVRPGHTPATTLARDLDRIIGKAIADDPDRRYASAGQLGEEIARYLEGRPVLAQPDTLGYRVRTFVRRNPVAVGLATTIVVSLAVFAAISAWQARVLAEQRRVAQHERDTANHVVGVLVDLFQTTNPSVRPDGHRMALGEFLAGAQVRALDSLRDAPEVRARLQYVFGRIHLTRGAYADARRSLEDAGTSLRAAGGTDSPETLDVLVALGETWHHAGDSARATALLEEALTRHRTAYGDRDLRTAAALQALAPAVATTDFVRSRALLVESLEIRRALLPATDRLVGEALASLAAHHHRRGEADQARRYYTDALAVFRTPALRRHPTAISLRGDHATLLDSLGAHDEAAALQAEALELGRSIVGRESLVVANLLNNSGVTLQWLGRHREAEAHYRESFEIHRGLLGDGHLRTRNVARGIGRALTMQRRHAEALNWFDRAIADPLGDDEELRAGVWGMRAQRARVLSALDRPGDAVSEASRAVGALSRMAAAPGADNTARVSARAALGTARVTLGHLLVNADRTTDAEALIVDALTGMTGLDASHPRRAEAECELARARLARQSTDVEWARLAACLPRYSAWPLAEQDAVEALARLHATRPR